MWPEPRHTFTPCGILFGHSKHGPKYWAALPIFAGRSWVPIKHKAAWAETYLDTNWHLNTSSHLVTTDMGQKLVAVPLCVRRSWVPT